MKSVVEDFGIAEDGGLGDAFMGRVMVPLSEVHQHESHLRDPYIFS
jgi:hypothetical protein